MNKILPQDSGPCFGVGVIHLDTKEIRLFEDDFYGFEFGDFYINCNLKEGQNDASQRMNLLIFYCPIRYEETPWMCRNERPQGAEKPRRKACSTGCEAASPGFGGTPTSVLGISKRIFLKHCWPIPSNLPAFPVAAIL